MSAPDEPVPPMAGTGFLPRTRLMGRWVWMARLAWTAGFIVLAIMYAFGFEAVREALSTVCEKEPCMLMQQLHPTGSGEQVRGWPGPPIGYADPLRPGQVEALGTFGLTLEQYGWLGALQMGLPLLVYLLIAAGLFMQKSDDWMVLFASLMVATIPVGNVPVPFVLAIHQPAWEWVFDSANVVALSCFLIFPLIFPTGQFVPRWTRWVALFDIAFAVMATIFLTSISGNPDAKKLILVCVLIGLGAGVYAQLYRYFRVASSMERQQIKWVIVGLAGFISISIAVLLPLDALLTAGAASLDPARALLLSAIPDTIFQVILLFIPVSIAISVLRYRLWDIDLIISRTLVYGALTASVVGLYVLIVGGFAILFQMRNNLPGTIIAIVLIAFLFQPLRQRLQGVANRFVPVRRSATPLEPSEEKITVADSAGEPSMYSQQPLIARVTWPILMISSAGVFVASIPGYISEMSRYMGGSRSSISPTLDIALHAGSSIVSLVSAFLSLYLAVMLIRRRPREWMALFVSGYLLIFGIVISGPLERTVALWPEWEIRASAIAKPFLFATPTVALLALFPSGKFVPRWTRSLTALSLLLIAAAFYLPPYWWPDVRNPIAALTAVTWAGILLAGLYAQVYRYRQVSNATERQQTKWVVFGFFVWMLLVTLVSAPYTASYGSSPFSWHPWWAPVVRAVWFLSSGILPVTLTIAVLRYRLFDIDLLINRTIVYLSLTAVVIGIYILVVGYLGTLVRTRNNFMVSLIAAGLVAVVFQPLRQRLQRGINHLMYGERDDPYAALARLGRRLEATLAPGAVLPTVVTTIREVMKLPYVAIYLKQDPDRYEIVAESASPGLRSENGRIRVPGMEREGFCLPLIHQGETLGYIVLGPRAPNEAFSSTDLHLLEDLAPQVGVAVHAARLTADLQRSRERLVLAREEERRRLRRDLHDDLAPTLASLGLTASTAADLIPSDPATAVRLVKELQGEIRAAVGNIRRLVYDLRPPALDELGLLAAVRERAAQYSNAPEGVHVSVDAPAELHSLPAAVEVAAYRIVQEALENVARHSGARHCSVRFENHNGLEIEITDDGVGLPPNIKPGVGLRSMHERAEELGGSCVIERGMKGGTRVLAHLPEGEPDGAFARADRR